MQITKKKAPQKPTYDSLRQSLEEMKSHCMLNGVTRVSMPRSVALSFVSCSNASSNELQERNKVAR